MRTEDIPTKHPAMWMPEQDPETLALIGKLGEETNELGARLFRAVIQGYQARDPEDGRSNADHIWDEIADVKAMIQHLETRRAGDGVVRRLDVRRNRKFIFKLPWFDWLRALTQEPSQ